jgi:hypothetical protein
MAGVSIHPAAPFRCRSNNIPLDYNDSGHIARVGVKQILVVILWDK